MTLTNDYKTFCQNIKLDNLDNMQQTTDEIAKKLNQKYYNLIGETKQHIYIVGSVGRKTAVKGSSDLDLIFDLPDDVYTKFDSRENNGQSDLLQEVKGVLLERYPKSNISGDGQVVVIEFDKYTVELVPGFKEKDNTFTYPDTHDGGSWKTTMPLKEQNECVDCNEKSAGKYYDFCHIIRNWKNTIGVEIGGLLIDTLIYKCFINNNYFLNKDYWDYHNILIKVFEYIKDQNDEQEFWYAVGSNQKVYKKTNSNFISKAQKAYSKLKDTDSNTEDINEILRDLLGKDFPTKNEIAENKIFSKHRHTYIRDSSTEEFIEELVTVDIKYSLSIDCLITQTGFRPFFLREFLNQHKPLKHNKHLEFFIKETDCPKPYNVFWKIRNVGVEAIKRNMIRGQIIPGAEKKSEHTNFYGNHYVECYLIKNYVCVARCRIDVPIDTE